MSGFGLILQHVTIQMILKQKVYENNQTAKNRDQLIRKIKSCEKKIESSTYQNLFATLKTKMRRAVEGGLESLL